MRNVEELLFESFGASFIESQFIGAQRVPERLKAGLGLRRGDAGLEACYQCEPNGLVVIQVVKRRSPGNCNPDHADGKKDAGAITADGGVEVLRRNAENCEWMPVDLNRLAHHIRRCGKVVFPIVIAEHEDRIRILRRIVPAEI